ncbi:MAG: hypothetical protein KatS3mg023_2273 [Armatimonadota bacterium]|nr:MAG: hypothetical protein KatS3mg023_2273 [Armatimonadota bacterium]
MWSGVTTERDLPVVYTRILGTTSKMLDIPKQVCYNKSALKRLRKENKHVRPAQAMHH